MSFITVAGENQIAAKQGASQTLNVVNFVLANIPALGTEPVDRIEAMPIAGNIVATLPVTQAGYVNGNQVVYSLTMDSSIGPFDFNWVGLVDSDSVLIAVSYVPTISKFATVGGVPGNNITRNFLIAYSGITATTALAVPAATWQIDFNARLHGIDERERASNFDIYGDQAFYNDGWLVVRQGVSDQYDISVGVGYVGGVRIDNTAVQVITGPPSTSVWLDVSLEGDISDVSSVVSFVVSAAVQNDYTDSNGFDHYLVKIADIAADGSVTDLRRNADFFAVHIADTNPHPQYLTPAEGDAAYESAFFKNTAFNKNFGTAFTSVARGNHTHTPAALGVPALTDFASNLSANGYQKISGGLIIQWGSISTGSAAMFPIAFPTACLMVTGSALYYPGNAYLRWAGIDPTSFSTTGFSWYEAMEQKRGWIAIGY